MADLQIGPETGSTDSGEDSCSLEVNQAAKIIVLDVRVGPVLQSQSRDRYVKIELEVSIGLASGGQVLADTSGLPINGPGDYRLLLPIEYPKALTKGTNRVAIVALTRYLDGYGNLALPLGRQLRYCNLSW